MSTTALIIVWEFNGNMKAALDYASCVASRFRNSGNFKLACEYEAAAQSIAQKLQELLGGLP